MKYQNKTRNKSDFELITRAGIASWIFYIHGVVVGEGSDDTELEESAAGLGAKAGLVTGAEVVGVASGGFRVDAPAGAETVVSVFTAGGVGVDVEAVTVIGICDELPVVVDTAEIVVAVVVVEDTAGIVVAGIVVVTAPSSDTVVVADFKVFDTKVEVEVVLVASINEGSPCTEVVSFWYEGSPCTGFWIGI